MTVEHSPELLGQLLQEVADMRQHQRMFFRSPAGSGVREAARVLAMRSERRVDALIEKLRDKQRELTL